MSNPIMVNDKEFITIKAMNKYIEKTIISISEILTSTVEEMKIDDYVPDINFISTFLISILCNLSREIAINLFSHTNQK